MYVDGATRGLHLSLESAAAVGRVALSFFPILLFSNCITTAPHVEKLFAKRNERDFGDGADDELSQGWANCAHTGLVNRDETDEN